MFFQEAKDDHTAKFSILTKKSSGRNANHVRCKNRRKKIESSEDETSDEDYA